MRLIEKVWFKKHSAKYWLVPLLLPLTLLFYLVSAIRRFCYRANILQSCQIAKPVIVVGNIGVGGNGKTPVVLHLIELTKSLGLTPGVISRGYGGKVDTYPYLLDDNSTSDQAGDEPILIYQRYHIPVVVGSDRIASAEKLIEQGCDIIISDDGLQHYRLKRDIELIIIDGKRLFGNGLLLPAGPLREGLWRLSSADFLIYNGNSDSLEKNTANNALSMELSATTVIHLLTGKQVPITDFISQYQSVNAIAGIGDPDRFFSSLDGLGFDIVDKRGFIDHKNFTLDDLEQFKINLPLLMTEKDAVKCQGFAQENWWYMPVDAQLSEQDNHRLLSLIKNKIKQK